MSAAYWVQRNRRDAMERAQAARRERSAHQAQQRESVAKYYKDLNIMCTRHNNLIENHSDRPSKVNVESRLEEEAKARRAANLEHRRARLTELLAKENEKYVIELKLLEKNKSKDPWNVENLKQQIEELNRRRDEAEESLKRNPANKFYHQVNVPYVKELQSKTLEKEVIKDMEQQRMQLENITMGLVAEEKQRKESLEELRYKALENAYAAETEAKECSNKFSKMVKQHSSKLEENTSQRTKIEETVKILQECEAQIVTLLTRRRQLREIQQQREQRIAEFRHMKERIRKMTTEKQHALDIDLSSITSLCNLETSLKGLVGLNFERSLIVKEAIEKQIACERKRENEMLLLFEEEAKRMWAQRVKQWHQEMLERENLLNDFIDDIKGQIKAKIDQCWASQKDLLEVRKSLVESMISDNERQKKEEQELSAKKEYFLGKVREFDLQLAKINPNLTSFRAKH